MQGGTDKFWRKARLQYIPCFVPKIGMEPDLKVAETKWAGVLCSAAHANVEGQHVKSKYLS